MADFIVPTKCVKGEVVQTLLVGIDLDVENFEAFEVVLVCLDVL